MLVPSFICSLDAGGFVTGMVDICLYGTIRSSSKLAPWNARHSTSGCHVACVERGWHRIFVLGCQLLWESNCSQRRGDCLACLCYVTFEKYVTGRTCYTVLLLSIIYIFLWQIKFRHGLPPGDGVLYYPGEVFSTNEPVASLRLERLLSGLQVKYLFLSPKNIANYSQQMCVLTKYLF